MPFVTARRRSSPGRVLVPARTAQLTAVDHVSRITPGRTLRGNELP
ncbi:hypothetical protein [Streptomyces xylophagus]|nr:hypothetical protein [Streptomyces xylophagus]